MEELFLAILGGLLELLAELFFEVFLGVVADLCVRAIRRGFSASAEIAPILAVLLYLSIGGALGALSVWLLPHPLVHPSRFHGISVLISPVVTGLCMYGLGAMVRRSGKDAIRIESFLYGFMFALGVAVVRFLFVRV